MGSRRQGWVVCSRSRGKGNRATFHKRNTHRYNVVYASVLQYTGIIQVEFNIRSLFKINLTSRGRYHGKLGVFAK